MEAASDAYQKYHQGNMETDFNKHKDDNAKHLLLNRLSYNTVRETGTEIYHQDT